MNASRYKELLGKQYHTNINHNKEPFMGHHMTNPNPKSLKQIAISLTLALGIITTTAIAGISIFGSI